MQEEPMPHPEECGTLIVTGASRGIGAAIARLAGERGYAVAVNFATGEAEARSIVEQITSAGGRAHALQADVSHEEDVIRLFETAQSELGPITALGQQRRNYRRILARGIGERKNSTASHGRERHWSILVRARSGPAHVNSSRRQRGRYREHFFARGTHRLRRRMGTLRGVEGCD